MYTNVHDQNTDQRIQRKDFPRIHLDVAWENLWWKIFRKFLPIYKSCSFIKSCGKPSTTMQERHDNDEIEPHNHNEYPLLYKEMKILTSGLGKFLECWKCYILLVTCALVIYLICMPSALGLRAYISGKSLVLMLQLLHITLYCEIFDEGKL